MERACSPDFASIATRIDNADFLRRSRDTLTVQAQHYTFGGDPFSVPLVEKIVEVKITPDVRHAFNNAVKAGKENIKVLDMARTRETRFFACAANWRSLDMRFKVASTDEEHAKESNKIIWKNAPDISGRLQFSSAWQKEKFDIVLVNSWMHYLTTAEELEEFFEGLKNTDATQIVLSNTAISLQETSADEYWLQRNFDKVTAACAPALSGIKARMNNLGYHRAEIQVGPSKAYDLTVPPPQNDRYPAEAHLLFERD